MEKNGINDPQAFQRMPVVDYKESEIDLYGFFCALFGQWKLILAITSLGTLFVGLIVLALPKQYQVSAQLTQPSLAQIQSLNIRGHKEFTPSELFVLFYDKLRSPAHLRNYLKNLNWLEKLYPSEIEEKNDILFADFSEGFNITVEEPKKEQWMEYVLVPSLISISMLHSDEPLIAKLLSDYIDYTNQYIISRLAADGRRLKSLEVEKIEKQIIVLRKNAQLKREFLIAKMKEAIVVAEQLGIKRPTTIESISDESKNARTLVNVNTKGGEQFFLMGTTYLRSKIDGLKQRKNAADQVNLQETNTDDPFIEGLPNLFKRLSELQQRTFDFNSAQVFRLHKTVIEDDEIENPNWKLILLSGFLVSGVVSLFVALIRGKRDSRLIQSN